jgi:hypothetical protein
MSKIVYPSFEEFYEKEVISIKNKHPNYIQLNGPKNVRSPIIFRYFKHIGLIWEIHEDTHIDRLDIAYNCLVKGLQPFKQQPTRTGNRQCLVLIDNIRPPGYKYMYIFEKR